MALPLPTDSSLAIPALAEIRASVSDEGDAEAEVRRTDQAIEYAFLGRAIAPTEESGNNAMLPYSELPDVMRCEGILFTAEEVDMAVEAYFGGRMDELKAVGLSLADVTDLYHYLVPPRQSTNTLDQGLKHIRSTVSISVVLKDFFDLVARLLRRKKDQFVEFFETMKPTNRLILVIVLISFVMALTVAGTAIGLNWIQAMKDQNEALHNDLDLVLRAMQDFAVRQMREHAFEHAEDTALKLKGVVQEIGHHLNLQTSTMTQLNGATIAAALLSQTLDTTTQHSIELTAKQTALMLDELCSIDPTFDVIRLVNGMNRQNRLPEGHEILLVTQNSIQPGNIPSIVTDLRYASLCPSQQGCNATRMASVLRSALLSNQSGHSIGIDYTGRTAYFGITYIPCSRLGLVYSTQFATLQRRFVNETIEAVNIVNRGYSGTTEIMLGSAANPGYSLTEERLDSDCDNCTFDKAAFLAITNAMNGSQASAMGVDHRAVTEVLSTAAKIGFLDTFLILEIDLEEIEGYVFGPLGDASDGVNPELSRSDEMLFGRLVSDGKGGSTYKFLSTPKFASECPNGKCQNDGAMYAAVVECRNGVDVFTDYRGVKVIAAYMCLPDLHAGMVLKSDEIEVFRDTIEHTNEYINNQNQQEPTSSLELMMGMMQVNPSTGVSRPTMISDLKYPDACRRVEDCANQVASFGPMVEALKRGDSAAIATDYRGKKVMTVYSGSNTTETIGFVFKIDSDEVEKPLVLNVVIVLFTALGIVIAGNIILGIAAHRMLASIQSTWDKSVQAVQEQKENFEVLLAALYPQFVKDKLVAGDAQIFLELKEATVFFSDICNFTMISNQLSAQELLQWIGYTFGVMDHCANYYAIYKIKTIGDAYLAVSGLPGLIPDGEADFHTLRMLQFASTCIQVFSGRYTHPDAGACLDLIASRSAVVRKERKAAAMAAVTSGKNKRSSLASSAMASSVFSVSPRDGQSGGKTNKSMCNTRYGIATGPLTAGVLQGKCPAFDVWGKTVNLACRMESTSRPNCIHCTESAYHAIMKHKNHPFAFDKPHSTYAKGFGNVPAYFVRHCDENPPKVLLEELSLEPAMGRFLFDIGVGGKETGNAATNRDSNGPTHRGSVQSSYRSQTGGENNDGGGGTYHPPPAVQQHHLTDQAAPREPRSPTTNPPLPPPPPLPSTRQDANLVRISSFS